MKKVLGLGLLAAAVYISWKLWPRAQAAPATTAPMDTGNEVIQAINKYWVQPIPGAPAPAPETQLIFTIPDNEFDFAGDPFLLEPITVPRETFGIAYPGGSATFDESWATDGNNQFLF